MELRHLIHNITLLILIGLSSTMCIKTPEKEITTNNKPSYTIIYYAVGGETLDEAIEISLMDIERRGVGENVKVAGCVKWTKGYTSDFSNGKGEVKRFLLDSNNPHIEMQTVGGNDYPMYDPENIAEFISWSKEVAPADNYILVLAGHGNGWHPGVGIESTRGILRDTDLNRYITLEELCSGIELSQTSFRMIHLMSCLMNNIEYLTPLSQYSDYILGSCHISVMLCTELAHLARSLSGIKNNSDKALIGALEDLLHNIVVDIESQGLTGDTLDYSITECAKINRLNRAIGDLSTALVEIYESDDYQTIEYLERELADSYYFIESYLNSAEVTDMDYLRMAFTYDIVDIAQRVARAIPEKKFADISNKIEKMAKAARIANYTTQLSGVNDVYYGITLTNSTQWSDREYEKAGYEETLFNQITHWSEFLKRNNIILKH